MTMNERIERNEPDEVAAVERCAATYRRLRAELAKAIVGQDQVIEQVMIALLARGHALIEGVPGLAKTLLVSALARALRLSFKRIQFTPDLMPGDVTGAEIIQEDAQTGARGYTFLPGPLFANLILADEINRTPPKTQAAMLEAMQERQVSVGGTSRPLPSPFFVLATQNPLEQEGTYPLPEAQLDRFLLHIKVGYPTAAEEWTIARRASTAGFGGDLAAAIEPILSGVELRGMQELAAEVPISDQVLGHACALVRASRSGTPEAPDFVNRWVRWGAGPRGVLALVACARARALLHGRLHAGAADLAAVAPAALRHRIAGNFAAQAEGMTSDQLAARLLASVPADRRYERPADAPL
jgi:MoxR-like ATPase